MLLLADASFQQLIKIFSSNMLTVAKKQPTYIWWLHLGRHYYCYEKRKGQRRIHKRDLNVMETDNNIILTLAWHVDTYNNTVVCNVLVLKFHSVTFPFPSLERNQNVFFPVFTNLNSGSCCLPAFSIEYTLEIQSILHFCSSNMDFIWYENNSNKETEILRFNCYFWYCFLLEYNDITKLFNQKWTDHIANSNRNIQKWKPLGFKNLQRI